MLFSNENNTRGNTKGVAEDKEGNGVYVPGYQDLIVPVGSRHRVSVNFSPVGSPEPTKATSKNISALQFIQGLNACAEMHMVSRSDSAR